MTVAGPYCDMLYMIIEHFRGGNPAPIYRRLREQGRMMPETLRYVGSWIRDDLALCYQVMECDDPQDLESWMSHWRDLTDFEVIPVITSAEAQARSAQS